MRKIVRLYLKKSPNNTPLKTVVEANGGKVAKSGKYDVIVFNNDCGVQPIMSKLKDISSAIWTTTKGKLSAIGYDITKTSPSNDGLREIQQNEPKPKLKTPKNVEVEPTPVAMAEPDTKKAEISNTIWEETTTEAE